jgi:hypothetical protein
LPDVFPDEAPEQDPAVDFDPADLFPGEMVDPWDCQADPTLWGDDTDTDRWELGPAADRDEPAATLSLADLVTKQAEAYRAWSTAAGAMIADCLDALAARIAYLNARTPAEFADRLDAIEQDARETWRDSGFQEGLTQARRECERRHGSNRGMFGHPASED